MTAQSSIGIACATGHTEQTVETLLSNADFALYRVKSEGRNGYRLFGADMDDELRTRRTLQLDLTEALARDEFELYFQPIVDLSTQETLGVEALLRWRHPKHGLIMPGKFITLAEEIGMMPHLGSWIIEEACRHAVAWPDHIKVAVNVSTLQIQGGNLTHSVKSALAKTGLAARRLELELTESALLRNDAETLATLRQLKKIGVAVVLDDFGTGYSSLTYLRLFPFDKIKIDRTFVSEISTNYECAAIVAAVINLARGLDMVATAEGVETQDQVDLLRAAGCTQAQGYLYAKPRPASELIFSQARPGFDIEWIDNPIPAKASA
jgi:predicted signal transduction protein with EAL and GGDEF domain